MRRFRTTTWIGPVLLCALFGGYALAQDDGLPFVPQADARTLELAVGALDTRAVPSLLEQPEGVFEAGRRYVVQLTGPLTEEQRLALTALGVTLEDYLPQFAYIARLDGVKARDLAQLGPVAWAGVYEDAWKLSPEIGSRGYSEPERVALEAEGKLVLDVTLFEGESAEAAAPALTALGAQTFFVESLGGNETLRIVLPQAALPQLAALPQVQFAEEVGEVQLRNSTTRWIVQTNTSNVTTLYNNGIRGEGQIVGILDGKINVNHCSFRDTVNPVGPSHRKILAYNTSQGYNQHGTHVAGTAVGEQSPGVNNDTRGIAYNGKLVFDDIPSFSETGVKTVLVQHHNQGARAHTNSWGDDGTTSYNGLCRGFDAFQYENEDSMVCLAVTNLSTLKNPENAKNLLAVGASQDTPNQASHCSGGAGPTADGRRKPEIYAPGCSTQSATGSGTSCSTTGLTGTSMASPAIAGTALLVRQYFTDGYYPTGAPVAGNQFTPSGTLVKAVLLNSAVDMTGISGYPSNTEGWGRVLADNALYFPGDARKLIVKDVKNASGLSTGGQTEYTFNVDASTQQLRVTLVFTEPPGTSGAANPVVNNLDLEVVNPAATLYRGNVFSGGSSTTGGTADAKNNVEQVHVNSPPVGAWKARVKGTNVAQGKQGYALVVSGAVSEAAACSADLDGDGKVCQTDLGILLAAYGTCPGNPGYNALAGAIAGDACVTQEDLGVMLAQYGVCGGACP